MILSESEKNRIKGLYGLVTEQKAQPITVSIKIPWETNEKNGFYYEVNDDYDELGDIIIDFNVEFVKKQGIKSYRRERHLPRIIDYEFKTTNNNFAKDYTESLSEYLKQYNVVITNTKFWNKHLAIMLKNNNTINESNIVEQSKLPDGIPAENLPQPIKDFLKKNKMVGNFYKGNMYNSSNTSKDTYTFVSAHRMKPGTKSDPITFTLQQMEEFNRNGGKLNQCKTQIKDYENRRQELRSKGIKGKEKKEIINKEFSDIQSCWAVTTIARLVERGKSTFQ